jgi:hypothetical protein
MRNAQPRRPPRRRPRRPTQKTPTILLAALTLASCKEDPPDIAECETGDGGTACDIEDPEPPPMGCANPEFDTSPPMTASEFECEGRAGGAIVFNQVIAPNGAGGPGAVQTTPAVTEFPSQGNAVSACCDQPDPATSRSRASEIVRGLRATGSWTRFASRSIRC